ncbi:putative calcium-binding protein, partial [Acidovorax sp. CF316]
QWIVLGPDDDIIHGGGGNDVVGSEAGDDQVYGDAGDDIVFGGAGNDLLSGGTGSDKLNGGTGFDVAIQEGARTDYTVTLDGAGVKLTHTASGVSDWLVDVEQVRFATGPSLTVAHSAAEEAGAYLFQKWLGRDLSQGEGTIIQSLTGKTALEVATLFAQFFPTQTAGKTAAQLLEGMASAGAIRVDAIREVTVTGDAGNNAISPTLGLARYVDGGAGIDTVVLPATLAQTHIQAQGNGNFTLQRMTDGAMLDVTRVERVSFSDTRLALDLNGNAGQAAKLLGALAGPGMLANKGVVGEVIRLLDAGATSQSIAGLGLQLLGASTPTQVAQTLWTNVVGRAGTDSELKILTDILAGGVSAAELVVLAANLEANAVRIDLVGLTAKGLEFA